jgi:hypothetical protein
MHQFCSKGIVMLMAGKSNRTIQMDGLTLEKSLGDLALALLPFFPHLHRTPNAVCPLRIARKWCPDADFVNLAQKCSYIQFGRVN